MNETGVALASAARTATTTSSTLENPRGLGVVLFLDVTVASGTGGLQVQAQAIDPTGGTVLAVNSAPTAVTATGLKTYVIYPGASAGATQNTSGVLPRRWNVKVTAGDSSSYTYSVSYQYVQ